MDIVLVILLRTAVQTAIVWYTSCYAMARGHCLNILAVLEAVHGFLAPFPPAPVPNKPPRFCGRKAKGLLTILNHI